MQQWEKKATSRFAEWDSGLWHQAHLRAQPLKKITVLIPGPS
jgi:hypothetical protein